MNKLVIIKKDLQNNIETIKKMINSKQDKKADLIAVVKANGMGLDLIQYTKFLSKNGIKKFAVATLEEAIKLRVDAKITDEILMMTPTSNEDEVKLLIKNNIILTVGALNELEVIKKVSKSLTKTASINLKIDTGFGRYGFLYSDETNILNVFKNKGNVEILGTFTHFSKCTDEQWTRTQFDRFVKCINLIKEKGYNPGLTHCASSTAFLCYKDMWLDAVRIGSALQGRTIKKVPNLVKIGEYKTSIIEIKELPKNFAISYGKSYITKTNTIVATISTGYIDGFNISKLNDDFSFKSKFKLILKDIKHLFKDSSLKVCIHVKEYTVVGKLGMYYSVVDISSAKSNEVKVGDEVRISNISPMYINEKIKREYI